MMQERSEESWCAVVPAAYLPVLML